MLTYSCSHAHEITFLVGLNCLKITNDHQIVENSQINEILSQLMTLKKILEQNLKDIITISLGDQLYIQLGTIVTGNT
jgi:hypothetical protein